MSMVCLLVLVLVPGVSCSKRCSPGRFGEPCDKQCSANCRRHTNNNIYCDKHTGKCLLGCKSGWCGHQCTVRCSKNCIDGVCYQQTGLCAKGCNGNYIGPMCDVHEESTVSYIRKCERGLYGELCEKRCNANCLSDANKNASCDKHTGKCLQGCNSGWCGQQCDFSCGNNCLDDVCDQLTGNCTKGCKGNVRGYKCNRYQGKAQDPSTKGPPDETHSDKFLFSVGFFAGGAVLVIVAVILCIIALAAKREKSKPLYTKEHAPMISQSADYFKHGT